MDNLGNLSDSHILVVDDNELNRDMLTRRLKRHNCEISEASDALQALELLENNDINLILLDIMMPDIDGVQLLQQLRTTYTITELPIIMVTAKDQSDVVVKCLEAGANDYVVKPIDFPVLLARVKTQLTLQAKERELKVSEERYRDLFENASDLIQIVNFDGQFLYTNKAWQEILGYSTDEIQKMSIFDIIPPPEVEKCKTLLSQLHQSQQQIQIETKFTTKEGYTLDVEGNISCRLDKNQQPISTRGIFRDITARKRSDQLKDELISVVSHELRTPLTSISGSLQLILGGISGNLSPQIKSLLDVANRNCKRLVRLINDFLDISKIESGHIQFKIATTDLYLLLQQALDSNQGYAKQYNVDFQLNCELNPPRAMVQVDHDRIIQVLTNLLSNASKFSPPNSTVQVSLSENDENFIVKISDQGSGIPPEFHKHMFQKFSQADSSSSRKQEGTGLGLSICKAIIERHHGRIDFESRLNQGTTFYFEIPKIKED